LHVEGVADQTFFGEDVVTAKIGVDFTPFECKPEVALRSTLVVYLDQQERFDVRGQDLAALECSASCTAVNGSYLQWPETILALLFSRDLETYMYRLPPL
jgi:hypothetical protein